MPVESKTGGVAAYKPEGAGITPSKSGRRIGGVARKHAHEAYVGAGPVPAAPAHSDFVWNGGPVLTCPFMYATF